HVIGEAAVGALQAAVGPLDHRSPADWPAWRGLARVRWPTDVRGPAGGRGPVTVRRRISDRRIVLGWTASASSPSFLAISILMR
ncbi:MAG TPA: hypothetical protein VN840_03270, partial [Streptosporangiaceae bacterium]|nr:hypothetical protein [Streptosporangiaceae bacterium]